MTYDSELYDVAAMNSCSTMQFCTRKKAWLLYVLDGTCPGGIDPNDIDQVLKFVLGWVAVWHCDQ